MSPNPHKAEPQRRLPLAFEGSVVLWTVGWYAANGNRALAVAALLAAALAVVLPRSLPSTVRSFVWCGLLCIVVLLTANLEKVTPPETGVDLLRRYQYHRVATIGLGLAVAVLFFRPARWTITVLMTGCLPMLMVALMERQAPLERSAVAWGTFVLMLLASHAQRWADRDAQSGGTKYRGVPWFRLAVTMITLVMAFGMAVPLQALGRITRDWMLEVTGYMERTAKAEASHALSLRSPPGSMAGSLRPVLSIQSPSEPGYLRESVYLTLTNQQWTLQSSAASTQPLQESSCGAVPYEPCYQVGPLREESAVFWDVRVLYPAALRSYCLPACADLLCVRRTSTPGIDSDGIVTPGEEPLPSVFAVRVHLSRQDAYPGPNALDSAGYLDVPPHLEELVMTWVAQCPGLQDAETTSEALTAVERYFHYHFDYTLQQRTQAENCLQAFMQSRQGHCTLFASASALMLRACDIPTRVVAGYYCVEPHPMTGRWVARERNAHAWCETWDAREKRWRLVEATPPAGLPASFAAPGKPRLVMEWMASGWRSFLYAIRDGKPLMVVAQALQWIYRGFLTVIKTPWGSLLLLLVATLGILRWYRRRRPALDSAVRMRMRMIHAMAKLEQRMAPAGLRRSEHEPWEDWFLRVGPHLGTDRTAVLRPLLQRYQSLRYRSDPARDRVETWLSDTRQAGLRKGWKRIRP